MKPQTAPLIVRTALREAFAQLRAAGVPSHTLAAELLLMHALGRDRTWLYAHPEEVISDSEVHRSEEHTSELQSPCNLVCRLLLEKKKTTRAEAIHLHKQQT